jgi:hypothetical protein
MRATMWALIAVFAIATVGCQKAQEQPQKPRVMIPKGTVIIRKNLIDNFVGLAQVHMQMASDAFKKKDMGKATQETKIAEAFLRLQATTASGEAKQALQGAIDRTAELASNLQQGTEVTADDLNRVFAQSDYALALHHYEKAGEGLTTSAASTAGAYMNAASSDVEAAIKWIGRRPAADERAAMAGAHQVASRILGGAEWTVDQANSALADLRVQIDKLHTEITPPASESPATQTQ